MNDNQQSNKSFSQCPGECYDSFWEFESNDNNVSFNLDELLKNKNWNSELKRWENIDESISKNKVGHEFYVIMVKRRDGELYCDLAKTNQQIYLTLEDAEKEIHKYPHHHIVKMIASLGK